MVVDVCIEKVVVADSSYVTPPNVRVYNIIIRPRQRKKKIGLFKTLLCLYCLVGQTRISVPNKLIESTKLFNYFRTTGWFFIAVFKSTKRSPKMYLPLVIYVIVKKNQFLSRLIFQCDCPCFYTIKNRVICFSKQSNRVILDVFVFFTCLIDKSNYPLTVDYNANFSVFFFVVKILKAEFSIEWSIVLLSVYRNSEPRRKY